MIKKMASRNNAYLHMKFKILNPNDRISQLGQMDIKELTNNFMHNMFSEEAIQQATLRLVAEELLDVSYVHTCENCSLKDVIHESNYMTKKVLKEYRSGMRFCSKCGKELNIDPNNVVYSIPNSILSRVTEPSSEAVTLLSRFRKWLGIRM